jgi:predicted MFS family arabinose efflux permease
MVFFNDLANTAMTFLFASAYIPYFYLQDYVRSQTTDPRLVEYALSIMNAASFFGRILPNWLADW